jgi:photosystem II stability/assembly factor-like uncharacterized protein
MHSANDVPRRRPVGVAAVCVLFLLFLSRIGAAQTGWQPQGLPSLPAGETYHLASIKGRTSSEAWMAGSISNGDAVLLKTLNGTSWSVVYRAGSGPDPWTSMSGFTALSVVDANNAWAGGLWGMTAYTTDGGVTWRHDASLCATPSAPAGTLVHAYGIKAMTASNVWVAGWDGWDTAGQIWHRPYTGNCASWSYYPYRLEAQYGYANVYAIDAADGLNAWAVRNRSGSQSVIVHTTNGGDTWIDEATTPSATVLFDVIAVSATVAWAVGDGGLIMKTVDGGTTWTIQGAGVASDLRRISAVSANVAWAVGGNGVILKTIDGGATWRQQVSGVTDADPPVTFVGLAAVDANTAWAISDQNTVFKVSDGGTYLPLSSPRITSITPAGVPAAGSATVVSIYGMDLRPGARVYFAGVPAVSVRFSSGSLDVTAPVHAAGVVDVQVVNPDGASDTLANAFAFAGTAPVAVKMSPSWGYLNTAVTTIISGAGFTPDETATDPLPTVAVNGTPVTASWAGYNDVQATFPSSVVHAAGIANVTVTTAGGASNVVPFAVNYGQVTVTRPSTPPYDAAVTVPSLSGDVRVSYYGLNTGGWVQVGKAFERPYTVGGASLPPAGYALLTKYYYEVLTSASMRYAAATFCLPYADADASEAGFDESKLRVLSYDDASRSWYDITFTLNTETNTICGTGASIAYLALAQATVVPPPSVTSVTPAISPSTGGGTVKVTGLRFQPGATATFGGVAAASTTVINGMQLTTTVPGHALGVVDLVVTNPDTQPGTLTTGFEYVAAPTVTAVSPARGRQAGYNDVTITGTGFRTGLVVQFGGTAMSSSSVVDDTTITGSTPAHAPGVVDVVVTNADGQSGKLTNGFTYLPPPTVKGVVPGAGPTTGGTPVTITGTNFESPVTVTIGCAPATNAVVVNSTTITASTPACSASTVNVSVTNPDNSTGFRSSAFTFGTAPRVDAVLPTGGTTAGGTMVTISGVNFQTGATVTIGGSAATDVTVGDSTAITARTSPHAAGLVSVVVANPDAQAATLAYAFSYVAPPTFSDTPLQAYITAVKATHVSELRTRIDQLRARFGLSVFTWTDPTLTARSTTVRSVHLTDLRLALNGVYGAAGLTPPAYTSAVVTPRVTAITVADIAELRAAVLAIW